MPDGMFQTKDVTAALTVISVGRLGATVPSGQEHLAEAIRADMIERRILRIEAALRRAGIEVEDLDLPDGETNARD